MPTKDPKPPVPPPTGAYYRVRKPVDILKEGDLVLMWVQDGQIHAQKGEEEFSFDEDEVAGHFVLSPEGREEQLKRIGTLLMEAHEEKGSAEAVPQLPFAAGAETEAAGTALVTTKQRNSIIEAKKSALLAKNRVELIKAEMTGLLSEQQKALDLAASKWERQLGKLNYAITSINLYLGRDEQIVCIQEGEAASVEDPIAIRQTILYMDEETALFTEEGGLDFKRLGDFDQWLCQPQHLQQILPEPKGIIALRLRRNDKFYANEDVWTQIMLKQANGGTYILVRNGQRLWRIWNEIELPDHLFPTKSEFESLFYDRWNKDNLRPGSLQYQKALAEAEGLQKRYLQVVLLMQGLLDRTQIFKPLSVERVNLMDPDPDPKLVRLIRDAENILRSGRPTYSEWLKNLNNRLDVGKRIVFGGTNYLSYQYESQREGYSRTRPKFTPWPEHLRLYSLKGISKDGDFYFPYPRQNVTAPATFHCRRHDTFILNFDDAIEEDIQFYLGDRCNRHHYLSSFSTLKAALALKIAEREVEQPFVDLLVREAVRKSGASEETARQLLSAIIPWWKQKTQISRNLTKDEKAAYSQILREVQLRIAIRKNPAGAEAAQQIQQARPNWLVIAKDTGNTVVCLRTVPEIMGLVTREEWDVTGTHCVSTSEWHMPDSEHGRWEILAASSAWEQWPKHGRRGEFLTEPEYQQLLRETLDRVASLKKGGDIIHLVAITAGVRCLYLQGIFERNTWSGHGGAEWSCKEFSWERTKTGIKLEDGLYHWRSLSSELALDSENRSPNDPSEHERQWEHVQQRLSDLTPAMAALPFTVYGHRLLLLDDKALQESRKIIRKQQHRRQLNDRRRAQVQHFSDVVRSKIAKRFWEHERNKYLADGGLPDLWEDHAKTIKYKRFDLGKTDLESCLDYLINKAGYHAIVGKTLAAAWKLAKEMGWKPENEEADGTLSGNIILRKMKDEE